MDMQVVPKIGISSVVHSKHIDPGSIDVVGNDIALFDTESVISLYNGPSKLEVVSIGLCLEGSTRFNISLREFELIPGRMVIALPNQIIEHRQFSSNFRGIFFAVSKSCNQTPGKNFSYEKTSFSCRFAVYRNSYRNPLYVVVPPSYFLAYAYRSKSPF